MARVSWCPAQQSRGLEFDPHQFYEYGRFLNVRRDGISDFADLPGGISYTDLQDMHVKRVRRPLRRLPTPEWAMRDDLLCEVLVSYLEQRFHIRRKDGSPSERLERCRAAAKQHAKDAKAKLEQWIREYRAISEGRLSEVRERSYARLICGALRGHTLAEQLRRVELQIQNLDSDAFLTERAAEIAAALVYFYHRLGWNSCTVAEQLGLKSPHVRQILFRLARAASQKERSNHTRKPRVWLNQAKAAEIRRLSASGMPWKQIAARFGIVPDTVRRIVQGETWRATWRKPRGATSRSRALCESGAQMRANLV
jgi:predicted transcriptional regulator